MNTLRFLGTGTSCGVPQIGCTCPVCTSSDPHDARLRTSVLLETDDGVRLLFDCGPDFRQQMLGVPFGPLHAVLISHEHYDHVGGLDDLRPFKHFGQVDVYAETVCASHLREHMPYCFGKNPYPGSPRIDLHAISAGQPFAVCGHEILPIEVLHGKLPILAFRIGSFAYVTDMSAISPDALSALRGVRHLVINALRTKPHPTHQTLDEALAVIRHLSPEQAWLVHMSHEIGLHAEVQPALPPHVTLAYDGMVATW